MAANATPPPPPEPAPSHKTEGVAREDASTPDENKPVEDAASVRAEKVSMAEDGPQTTSTGAARPGRPMVDVMV
jgi:hypothetical protein